MLPGKTSTMSKFQRSHLLRELKTNLTRNLQTPKALSPDKIKANLAQLEAHFGSAGKDAGQKMAEIVADMHPTVREVYKLMQGQTKTIVAAINKRHNVLDRHMDYQTLILERIEEQTDRQTRVLRGINYEEDLGSFKTNRELLAHNCQAVRAMQSQNINLRAEMKAFPNSTLEEQRERRLASNYVARDAMVNKNEADRDKRKLEDDAKQIAMDAKTAATKKTREDTKAKNVAKSAEKKAAAAAEKKATAAEKKATAAEKKANKPKPKRVRKSKATKTIAQLITVEPTRSPDTTAENVKIFFTPKGAPQAKVQPRDLDRATEVTSEEAAAIEEAKKEGAESEEELDVN
jgi:hypothetical protein